jgi:NAD(P)-dependent dehydrogenase (short-subunit alcohol dehydrogenase family)
VALVTGGLGGLGLAIGRAFAGLGARVALADVAARRDDFDPTDEGMLGLALDVGDEASWTAALDRSEAELGPLDVLVNCAGVFRPNIPFEEMPLDTWREHLRVNADGVFLGCKHAIRRMKGRGGAVVNLGSGMSIKPIATASAYCASKAAVLMTTRTAALAGGPHGVRVNAVLPGAVDTEMLRGNLGPGEPAQPFFERLASASALGGLATSDDIARAVVFLAHPDNRMLTGTFLPVDGGNLVA